MDEYALARFEPGSADELAIGRAESEGKRSRLFERQILRLREKILLGQDDELRVRALALRSHEAVARLGGVAQVGVEDDFIARL